MKRTHPKSRIIQFHHNSDYAKKLLGAETKFNKIVLQIEVVEHKEYDFIAEIIEKEDYEIKLMEEI